ncbi:MAG: 4a-hydroxytetrahydrobiopterin dehydratase [Actinomycetota bacterium]|nr:4a-hydroxytetrahydrobiopterin dehydratase [Actinomycetota bacterium]
MVTPVSALAFAARDDLSDWRYLLGRIQACYRMVSFEAAADLVTAIAAAAESAGHHPDLDVRYPGMVHVALTTHAVGHLTERDVELAATIARLAATAGATSEPFATQALEVAIDAVDIPAVLPFWRAVLGYVDEHGVDGASAAIVDPARIGPAFWFQQMDEPRPQRNRIHVDVTLSHDVAEERIAAAIAAGGHLVSDERARAFWILADAERNEICVCTWQDRD